MATKKTKKRTSKTSAKTSKASASTNKASTSSYTNPYASAFNSNDAQNYMKNFMNSWNTNNAQSFNPANMQQMAAALMNTSQKNIETLTACTQIAVERCKDLMEQQANFASRMMQETASTVQEAFSGSSEPRQKMEEMADYAKYCVEKTAAYARKTAEENMQVAQQIGETLNQRATESFEEIRSAA